MRRARRRAPTPTKAESEAGGARPLPLRTPADMAELVRRCRQVRRELLSAGGATIATPQPPEDDEAAANFPVRARTVVQIDGDVLYLVDPDTFGDDPELRRAHVERVARWFADLRATVATLTVAVRRVGAAAGAAVLAVAGWESVARSLAWGLGTLVLGTLPVAGARLALRLALRGRLRP